MNFIPQSKYPEIEIVYSFGNCIAAAVSKLKI